MPPSLILLGLVHVLVSRCLQLRHHEEDQRLELEHRRPGFPGPTLRGQGLGADRQSRDHGICNRERRTPLRHTEQSRGPDGRDRSRRNQF